MAWKKVPRENEELLDRAFAALPEAEKRKMFGCPAYFLNGNMMAGAHQDDIMVRLSPEDEEDLLAQGGKPFTPMEGRTMKSYFVLPPQALRSEQELVKWLMKARDYTATLPPKEKKPGKT